MKGSNSEEKISLVETGGSSVVQHKNLFSKDSKYLLCPCGNVVKVLVIQTGECLLKLIGHKEQVTGICPHPKIKLQIFSASLDRSIKLWDYEDGIELANFNFKYPLHGVFTHFQTPTNNLLFFVQKTLRRDKNDMEVCSFNFEEQNRDEKDKLISEVVAKFNGQNHAIEKQISFSKDFFAVHHFRSFTAHRKGKSSFKKIRHELKDEDEDIMCLVCHPTDHSVVTGHRSGKIRFWSNIFDQENVVVDTQHWHSSQVETLCFTPNGHSLLSGGGEGVLVQWKNNNRDFLPRLGTPICWISVADDNSLYSTSHFDNSLLIITNNFTVKQSFEGFASSSSDLMCGFKYDPTTRACVTNGKPGHLLFYFPKSDTQLYNLDVVEKNYVYPLNPKGSKTNISALAFTKSNKLDHRFMATMEYDTLYKWDQKLKFWKFDETEQIWSLDTIVVSPHRTSVVTSINFHPTQNYFVSTDMDGQAKTWNRTENGWESVNVLSYKNQPCFDSSFSQDGSLLALVFGHVITLCNPLSEELIIFASCLTQIKSVEFGNFGCCHNLVILSSDSLQSWDLISGDLLWLVPVTKNSFLRSDSFSSNMAVFEGKHLDHLHIFRPNEKLPAFSYKLAITPIAAEFIPSESGSNWSNQSELYIVSDDMSVHSFSSEGESNGSRLEIKPHDKSQFDAPIAQLLSAKTNLIDDKQMNSRNVTVGGNMNALKTFEVTPCHMLSSMSQICDEFLSTLLVN